VALPDAGTVAHYTGVPAAGTRYYWDPVLVTGTGDRTKNIICWPNRLWEFHCKSKAKQSKDV